MARLPRVLPLVADDPCEPGDAGSTLDLDAAAALARKFQALSDPQRVRLLSMISAAGEACLCELTGPVGLSQPTVSHHMKRLVDAGLATREQRGRWAYFRPVPEALADLAATLAPIPSHR